ncbi:tetratricopeptide repeat protein [Desulforapulum autotrophicum]|nr:tetratricopeptide repeat protein [Desulforapulum autotrophicum]
MANKKVFFLLAAVLFLAWFFLLRQTITSSFEQTGDLYFAQRDYKQAIVEWEKALGQGSNDPIIMGKIGNAYLRLAKFDRAEKTFERAVELDLGAVDIHFELVRLSLLNGEFASAENRCALLKTKVPFNPEVEILLGDMAVLGNHMEQAEKFYRNAVDLSNGSPRSLIKLATCLVMLGKRQEADTLFAIADKTGMQSPRVLVQMADYFFVSGRDEDAEACLVEALKKEPKDLDLKVRLARFYRSTHALERAETVFAALVADDPANLYFKKMVGDIYISLNKLNNAEQVISDMGQLLQKPDPDFEMLQGKYWLFKGNYVYAATHFKSAVDLSPGFFWAHYLLSVAYLMGGQNQLGENSLEDALYFYPDQPQALLLMASILYKKGKYSLGLDYLNRLKEKAPENCRAHRLTGLNLLALESYEKARVAFTSALLIRPEDPASLYLLGITAEAMNMKSLAIACYTKVLDKNPRLVDVIHRYASLLMGQGDLKAADGLMARLLDKNRDNPYYHYVAALVDVRAKRFATAEDHFKRAILPGKPLGEVHVGLADLYISQGRILDAISTLEACTSTIPCFVDAWTGLAGIYLKTDKPLEALAVMERAEKKLPDSPAILGNLAWLYLETESDLNLALDFARKAYELSPGDPAISDTLAWAYYKKGAFSQAAGLLASVEEKDPKNGVVLYHHGMTLYGQGKLSEAVEKLKKAAKTALGEADLNQINEILSRISSQTAVKVPHAVSTMGDKFKFDTFELEKSPFQETQDAMQSEEMLQPQWQN